MPTLPWLFFATACGASRIGIVTMHSPEIMSYANTTSLINQQYAERHSYGYHVLNHTIDTTRIQLWSKILAILMHLPDYDFVFWIDADAIFYDHTRRIEDVLQLEEKDDAEIWCQDMWPDYPSVQRKEVMDGSSFLLRNSLWVRRFLIEMYYYPQCKEHLHWGEQFCISVLYTLNFMDVRSKIKILPAPAINNHRLPPPLPSEKYSLFIWHLAGRSMEARQRHFRLVHEDFAAKFRDWTYQSFWFFYELFARQNFGGLASQQLCMFGIGHRQQAMMEAMMYHFPYITGFVATYPGRPGLFSQLRKSEEIGDRFGSRMASIDLLEYSYGKTRTGEEFVKGFFCDILVLSPESWRHLPQGPRTLMPLVRAGLEHYEGPKGQGFGYSGVQDVLMVLVSESCKVEDGSSSDQLYTAEQGEVLDADDPHGEALKAACELMSELHMMLQHVYEGARESNGSSGYFEMVHTPDPDGGPTVESVVFRDAQTQGPAAPIPWDRPDPKRWKIESIGHVTVARLPRFAFPSVD